jgi:hypothetical protein
LLPSERKQFVRTISLLVLLVRAPSDCWVTSGFFSAVCVIINAPMAMHNRHSSSKVNPKVQSRPKRRHCRLHLPPSRCLRHLLFLLLHQLQQLHSHDPFYCGFFSLFFSDVPLPRMRQMGINSIAYVYLSHLVNLQSSSSLCSWRVPPRSRFGFNVIPSNLGLNLTKFLAPCPGCKFKYCTSRAPVRPSASFLRYPICKYALDLSVP